MSRDPMLKINYIPGIETTGAKEGFTTFLTNNGKTEANYNNKGRFTFESVGPIVLMAPGMSPGGIPYSQFRKERAEWEDKVRWKSWGMVCFLQLRDIDNDHTVITWMNSAKDKDDTPKKELDWFGELVTDMVDKYEITDENKEQFVFEIGKEPSKKGNMGRRFIRYLGEREDVLLLSDPNRYNEERRNKKLEEQSTPEPKANIENFELNDKEKQLVEMLDELAKQGRFETVTESRLASTLEEGYGGKIKTTKARAAYIAAHSDEYFQHLKVED